MIKENNCNTKFNTHKIPLQSTNKKINKLINVAMFLQSFKSTYDREGNHTTKLTES